MTEQDALLERLNTAEAVRDDARAAAQRRLDELRALHAAYEDLRVVANALDDASAHCRACRDCGDGPCCDLCGVAKASADLERLTTRPPYQIRVCNGCRRRDGSHEIGCREHRRQQRDQLQATCDHRGHITQTTGAELGPPTCDRCGSVLDTRDGSFRWGAVDRYIEYKRDPTKMTSIVVSWPAETYGPVSLFDDADNPPLRGWAEPSEIPGRPNVCLRANGESSWMSQDDARRLAAMLIAAANGINAFNPTHSRGEE